MILVDMKSLFIIKKSLDELVGWLYSLKTMKRSRILYTGIMCIKGDDILNTHIDQLMKCIGTVKRLSSDTFVLAALIKIWHDYVNSAGFSADGSNDTLHILEMVIRRHEVCVRSDRIGKTVVGHIYHNIDVVTTDRFVDGTLGFAGTETGILGFDNVRITFVSLECERIHSRILSLGTPFNQPVIHLTA